MLAKTQDNEEIIERVAALDIGEAELMCCVRVPDEDHAGRRLQEVDSYSTMTRSLLGMAGRLACLGVTGVVMEAASDCWKPVCYLLEAAGFAAWLVNATGVRHRPGRPKPGKLDCIWLCKVAERQMIRPGFVPPPPIRTRRDLTRYRAGLVAARTAEKNRAEKLREDAQIKLPVVACDIFGAWGRDMLAALAAGQRNPTVLPSGPGTPCAPRSPCWRRRSPATSPITTPSCWARCWPVSMRSAPTSQNPAPGSRR